MIIIIKFDTMIEIDKAARNLDRMKFSVAHSDSFVEMTQKG